MQDILKLVPRAAALVLSVSLAATGGLAKEPKGQPSGFGIKPTGATAKLNLAKQQLGKNQFKEAEATLLSYGAVGKKEGSRLFHLARAQAGQKKYTDAELSNQKALAVNPGLMEAWYNNACYAALAGDKKRAFAHLESLQAALKSTGTEFHRKKLGDLMVKDKDLDSLRADKRFVKIQEDVRYGMPKSQYDGSVSYRRVIDATAAMPGDAKARKLAKAEKLEIMNVTWEDTGRYKNSSVGPNISDMTIQVAWQDPRSKLFEITAMPVIRHPNYSDVTADLDPMDFTLLVGNERNEELRRVSLHEFLTNPTAYLHNPKSWAGPKKTLLAPQRDEKVLVSAQAAFLPIPKNGTAEFNPVIFNYPSRKGEPAVLTILATREGTSVTVIDNTRDAFSTGSVWGQRLFHNENGQRASLTGERKSDFKAKKEAAKKAGNPSFTNSDESEDALNLVLLIQVPLKYKEPVFEDEDDAAFGDGEMYDMESADGMAAEASGGSDVEAAVIGHGKVEGPFTEIDNLTIERDERFPVRVTVQFYQATSNGVVDAKDLAAIRKAIDDVYAHGDAVGSLVTGGETNRITEYAGAKVQPAKWWEWFWDRYEKTHEIKRAEAIKRLTKLLGKNYEEKPVTVLYLCDLIDE